MSLIHIAQHTKRDLEAWERIAASDLVVTRTHAYVRKAERSVAALVEFAEQGLCYCGVSWGKDSVVVAHMVAEHTPDVPLIWIRVDPIENPHCELVRDAFLGRHPQCTYDEIVQECRWEDGDWHASGTLERGFAIAQRSFGARHVSGIRGEESGSRKLRMMKWGHSSTNSCAPIGWWAGSDVFAYLHAHDLPIHPAYAMTMGGLLDRERIRVASLGGRRGDGMGRVEWERLYYGWRLAELRRDGRSL